MFAQDDVSAPQAADPRSRTRSALRRLGLVLLVALAVLLGAVAAAFFYAKHEIADLVTPRTAQMQAAQDQLVKPLPGKPTNILLLGSDQRKYSVEDKTQRSDTMLLVRLDPKRKTISMLSFPRDLYVEIPGQGEKKINDAYTDGGPALSVKTIKSITGLDVNMVMNVDFTGFRGVVDTLGGVWVDVDHTYFNPPNTGYDDIDIKPGYQLLGGRDALDFARYRHNDTDFHRIARQQLVLAGLKKQVAKSSLSKNVPGLFRVFRKNTEVVAGGGNDIDVRVLYDYLRLGLALDSKDVFTVEYDGEVGEASNGASIVVFDQAKMDAAVKAFLAPSADAREKSADQLVGKRPVTATDETPDATEAEDEAAPVAPAPSTVTVKVLNGSGTSGVARTMAQQLSTAGYRVDPTQANADAQTYASTKVFYGTPADEPAADALASRIEGATVAAKDASNAFTTKLLVVVGRTGTQLGGAGTNDGTVGTDEGPTGGEDYSGNVVPDKSSANVTVDANYGREEFLDVTTKGLPIMYPTVRATGSTFQEVHQYQFSIGRGTKTIYDAYRLVAKISDFDYYGVQATSWPNPPILEGATREVRRPDGRTYQLYFNGTKLHMVAWRQGAGTYWVSNTVLDKLTNETMLAIADGVKPLT